MPDLDVLRTQAERIRASGVLGRSELLERLFGFLLACTLAGRSPKEIEVAVAVFRKAPAFDVSSDAVVRVYVHKLRRKLEGFYAGPGSGEQVRVVIPKGSYRFALEPADKPVHSEVRWHRPSSGWIAVALATSILVNLGLIALSAYWRPKPITDELHSARSSPIWSHMLGDDRTIFVVLGDYYIFGETDRSMELRRLVREFSINSPSDLEQYVSAHPEFADRYLDLNLGYLPTSAAFALREVIPLVAASNKRVRVALASELSPEALTSADIIYIGYLSGMGMLHDFVFAGSRFHTGETFDEVVDRTTGTHYVSQAAVPLPGNDKYHDYGYMATLTGPNGNQILIIAGARDEGVMQVAEVLGKRSGLDELIQRAGGLPSFEALYDVYGMDRMNMGGKLLITSRLDTNKIWTGEPARARVANVK